MMTETNQEFIRRIKEIGESLIKNADSLVGNEKFIHGINITININPFNNEIQTINVNKEYVPEGYINRVTNTKYKGELKREQL